MRYFRSLGPSLIVLAMTGPAAAQSVRLDAETAARMAVEASTLTEAAADRVQASVYAVEAADAARMPVLAAAAGVAQLNNVPEFSAPVNGPGQPPTVIFPNITTWYQADLSLTQPLWTGGAISAGREAARMDKDAAGWSAEQTALELRFHARISYWSAVAAAAAVEVAKAQRRRAERLLDDSRALRAAGMAVDADVFAGEARVAAADVDLIRAQTEDEQALAGLRSLLGLDRGTTIVLADARTETVPAAPGGLEQLEAEALTERPELKIADARIGGLGARERAVNAARRPAVALSGQWMVARPNQRFLPLEDAWNDSWRVGVLASWQLFDGNRTRAQAATVRAERDAVSGDRGELERRLKLEVETSRLELGAALDAVPAADASRRAAAAWEESSKERYAAGLAPISEMLDAQADLTAAEVARIRTRVAAWIAEAALQRAVGR